MIKFRNRLLKEQWASRRQKDTWIEDKKNSSIYEHIANLMRKMAKIRVKEDKKSHNGIRGYV